MKQKIYIPAAPALKDQLDISAHLCRGLDKHGYESGLMLVPLGGIEKLQQDSEVIKRNICSLLDSYYIHNSILMLWPRPCEDTDILNKPKRALKHITCALEILNDLPFDHKQMTFHLGSLVSEEELIARSAVTWRKIFFKKVVPILKKIREKAMSKHISALVETTSVPEYRNIATNEKEFYGKIDLTRLRNPYYLTSYWGIKEIKRTGLGVCVDISHNRTIYELARREPEESYGVLFKEDLPDLRELSLMEDLSLLDQNDMIHLSDGSGVFTKNGGTYSEGVTLGIGEIQNLKDIIKNIYKKRIPCVIEVEESDYSERPNTVASIKYIQKVLNNEEI